MALRVAAVGEIVEDCYLDSAGTTRELGGISVNFARCALALGAEATLYAPLGDDERASRLGPRLRQSGLTLRLSHLAGPTAEQRIEVLADGERRFCGFDPGVLVDYAPGDDDLAAIAMSDLVAVPCSQECHRAFLRCVGGVPADKLVADFSQDSPVGAAGDVCGWLAPHLDRLAVAFVGGELAHGEILRELSRGSDTVIVLTVGAAGAYAFRRGEALQQPSLATEVVDTTGCGDAFQAAFALSYFEGHDLTAALGAGSRMAARVAAKRGAAP